jgi:hypothetical protein
MIKLSKIWGIKNAEFESISAFATQVRIITIVGISRATPTITRLSSIHDRIHREIESKGRYLVLIQSISGDKPGNFVLRWPSALTLL